MKRAVEFAVFLGVVAGMSLTTYNAAAPGALTRQSPQVVPVAEEPRHHLVFTNDAVRILDVQIESGDTTLFHTHAEPIFYVAISGSRVRSQVLDGDWSRAPARPTMPVGTVTSNVRYADRSLTHRVDNVGDGLFRLIAVVNRGSGERDGPAAGASAAGTAGAAGAAPQAVPAGADGAAEVENRWFRGYRFTLEPRTTTGKHHHATPVVVVQVGEGSSEVNAPQSGFAEKSAPGVWSYHIAGEEHELRNVGESPVQLIEVEVR